LEVQEEKPRWKPIFIPPDLYETIRHYLESEDAGRAGIISPHGLVIKAVREFLKKRGYIEEYGITVKRHRTPPQPTFKLEALNPTQKEAVRLLTTYKNFNQQEAIKWVYEHPEEVKKLESDD